MVRQRLPYVVLYCFVAAVCASSHLAARKIALEEHVSFKDAYSHFNSGAPLEWYLNERALLDLEDGRIKDRISMMDMYGIDVMVLSMMMTQDMKNVSEAVEVIQGWNRQLADGVKPYPDRLRFFCTLPMFDPDAAISQLEWCMKNGSPGAMINGYSTTGTYGGYNYYDTGHYDSFWAKVEELGAIIYLHPRSAEPRLLFEEFPELQTSAWGFSMEVAEHVLRLMLQGFFDKHPRLRFIIGHDGEMLVPWAWRIDHRLYKDGWRPNYVPNMSDPLTTAAIGKHARRHNITYYLRTNFHVTTSGMFDTPAFKHIVSVMGPDRVMFSVDSQLEDIGEAARWFEEATADMEPAVAEKIARGNAAKLLGIPETSEPLDKRLLL